MNNTRYLREVDFARADFYVRTRLWNEIKSKGGSVAQICTNIRYRRFIRPFCFYTITTKVSNVIFIINLLFIIVILFIILMLITILSGDGILFNSLGFL